MPRSVVDAIEEREDERFALLVGGVTDYAIFMLDVDGQVLTWNAGAERTTGYTAAEMIGKNVAILFPPDAIVDWERERVDAIRHGRAEAEGWRLRKDGTRVWVNAVVTALRRRDGSLRGFAKITRDLTERRALDRKLRESEQHLQFFIGSVRDYAIFMLDAAGRVKTWNSGAQKINGYAPAEIIGRPFSVFYPEEEVRAGKCEAELIVATQEGRFEEEGWRLRKDGTRFWARVTITAVRDESGQLVGFGKVTHDLTARRMAEENLRQSELRLRQLIDSIQDYAVIMLDTSGRVTTWNAGAQRIKGYRADEIIGQHFSIFYPPEERPTRKAELELEEASRVGRFEEEAWRVRKDGSRFWANVVLNAVRSDAGELVGFSKVTRDLTERRRADEERAARHAAEAASREKDHFLAMLGHELRNPLAPMVTALGLMAQRCGAHSGRELQVMDRQLHHMVQLVDDLLDVSRFVNGRVQLARVALSLQEVVTDAVETATPVIDRHRHRLVLDMPEATLVVVGDRSRLEQVVVNLLVNAAKYTDPGGTITLRARRDGDSVILRVEDTGRGIAADLLPRIFDIFEQGPQPAERPIGGLGLGLALVRSIVQAHGGTVTAQSPGVGAGATFEVRLPAASGPVVPLTTEIPTTAANATSRGARILLVDDNEDARELTTSLLELMGYVVDAAADGVAALELARAHLPDVAVLDIGLPGMDGFELGRRLAELAAGRPLLRVALTGYGQAGDRDRSRQEGFERHLVKPVEPALLISTIEELVARAARPPELE